jgi:hypothetical protein
MKYTDTVPNINDGQIRQEQHTRRLCPYARPAIVVIVILLGLVVVPHLIPHCDSLSLGGGASLSYCHTQ